MIQPLWIQKTVDEDQVRNVSAEFNLPDVYARVMALRGITSRETSRSFFFPEPDQLHNPFLMKDMDAAVENILNRINSNQTILVFGDYDVDGVTGTSMFYLFLKSIGSDVQYYIPNRETEGYGVSLKGIDYAKAIGASLMVTCDCGINAVQQVDYARSLNVDVIITDHHKPDKTLPDALILNPNQTECPYPFKGLCGAGVIFKFALAIAEKGKFDQNLVWQHADLIALGIAADLVPVNDENRIITSRGLQLIQEKKKIGIAAMLKAAGLADKEITVGRLVFWMAPKINAAGRLGDAGRAVKLLTTSNPVRAREIAQDLEAENKRRQDITARIEEEVILKVHSTVNLETDKAIVIASHDWHQGVIGIVASRIKELFYRPTFIISLDQNGIGKGSGRSIPQFDLYDALTACKDDLVGFGGHPIAAGLTLKEEQFESFRKNFLKIAALEIDQENLIPILYLDAELQISNIDTRFLKFLKALSPYGPKNMRPKFVSHNLKVEGIPKLLGRESNVLKFQVKQDRTIFEAIGFNMTEHYEKLLTGKPIDIVYEIGENEWNGRKTIQLEVKDIKLEEQAHA